MKRLLIPIVSISLAFANVGNAQDDIQRHAKDTDALYRVGESAEDGLYTGISMSMLGWGLALATAFALIAVYVQGSSSGTTD